MWFWFEDALKSSLRKWVSVWCRSQITECQVNVRNLTISLHHALQVRDTLMKGAWMNKLIHEIHRHLLSVSMSLMNWIWSWFLKPASLLSHCALVAEDDVNKPQHLCPAPQLTEDWPQHSYLLSRCCSLPTSEKGEAKMNPPFLEPGHLGRSLCKCKLQLLFLLQCLDQPIS